MHLVIVLASVIFLVASLRNLKASSPQNFIRELLPASQHDYTTLSNNDEIGKGNCKTIFPSRCEMYPFVRYWKQEFSPNDCHLV